MNAKTLNIIEGVMLAALVALFYELFAATKVSSKAPVRRLPPAPKLIEAGDLDIESKPEGVDVLNQDTKGFLQGSWSNDDQGFMAFREVGQSVTWKLPVEADADYRLQLYFGKSYDYAKVRVTIDDQPPKDLDLYSGYITSTGPIDFGTVRLVSGKSTLKLEVIGTNPNASEPFYNVGFDGIKMEPVTDKR